MPYGKQGNIPDTDMPSVRHYLAEPVPNISPEKQFLINRCYNTAIKNINNRCESLSKIGWGYNKNNGCSASSNYISLGYLFREK